MQPFSTIFLPIHRKKSTFRRRDGGGNETHYHLDRSRSPTRTTWGIFQNQEGAIKDLPKTQRLYPNSKKFLDNISQLRYTLQMEEII
jgi:hypothetical protein